MKARKYLFAGLVSLSGASGAFAQFGAPPIPGPPAPAAVAPAAEPATVWDFLGISCDQLEECRRKKCKTPCGQLLNAMFAPAVAMTGGFIQPFCPLMPSLEDLADSGAVGAASKIQADEAGAKARRAAVRYLGTVDCHYWPEAEAALIEALRGDKNECVRYEAALSLGNGCCCTKKTMEALRIAASCSDSDGAPKETSDRVRAAAIIALQHCLSCFVDPTPPAAPVREGRAPEGSTPPPAESAPPPIPQPPATQAQPSDEVKTQVNTAIKVERPVGKAYYAKINQVPRQLIVEEARKVVAKYSQTNNAYATLRGNHSVVQIVERVAASPENDLGGTRAEVVSARPANVWDMLVRQSNTPTTNTNVVTVTNTMAPPVATPDVIATAPQALPQAIPQQMPAMVKVEPMVETNTTAVLPMPEPIKPLTPADIVSSPYGNSVAAKPKTKLETPARLPAVAAVETSQSMKPSMDVEAKLSTPVVVKMPTSVAQKALKAFSEPASGTVREQAADALTVADMASCSDLQPALMGVATGTEAETTRKSAIKALVRTECTSTEVLQTLEKLTEDSSAGIRVEAAIGLARLRLKAQKN